MVTRCYPPAGLFSYIMMLMGMYILLKYVCSIPIFVLRCIHCILITEGFDQITDLIEEKEILNSGYIYWEYNGSQEKEVVSVSLEVNKVD